MIAMFSEGHNRLRPVFTPVETRIGDVGGDEHCTDVSVVVFCLSDDFDVSRNS